MRNKDVVDGGSEDGPGRVIAGRYRLQRRLGRGGMGVVWEALDTTLDRKVAVKGLLYPGAASPDAQAKWVSRARREAQAIARIGHQNVVAVHDVVEDGNQVWIVMELLNSRSLADLLREQRQLSVPHAARIGLQVLRGLVAVHEAGVLHRDVKPHNILFRSDGRALLMDFGIATFEGATQVTRSHEIIGTPQYLAPELLGQTPADPRRASTASDLWSFGVTLYETVEGRRPFGGATNFELFTAVRESPVPPMRYAGPLTGLIEALLRKDPGQRPDAAEVDRMLQTVAEDFAVPDTPDVRPVDPDPPKLPDIIEPVPDPPRPRWRISVVAVCTALLLTGTAWFAWPEPGDTSGSTGSNGSSGGPGYDCGDGLQVGIKRDQPGLSVRDGGEYKGFEVELAKEIAKELGCTGEVEFSEVTSGNRGSALDASRVDLVLATYSINKQRQKEGVRFAGPYFKALRGLLVRKGRPYNSLSDLQKDPKVEVCTARNSVYEKWLEAEGLGSQMVLQDGYDACVKDLLDRKTNVYAVATDDVIVAGLADKYDAETKALPSLGGTEDYGVAMDAKEDALHTAVCAALKDITAKPRGEAATSRWADLYNRHLKPIMKHQPTPEEPELTSC
ncbi:serine/threonine protein kinase [Streptomyces carminius]|uniref:non-specific serine/threonine protein kinase n=1 Tax=Streptomyces carminius TaxID=2665496 RepID=A0A2M8LV47_9ACTN|nr:serine/threonine-protein kinase [Streptomyces carminius]PJE95827.1 serine/threonine protein kinase [Streptomyces carminius]